jgi:hypothetical protein
MRHLHIKAPPLPRRSLYAPATVEVVHKPIVVVHQSQDGSSRHGKYADLEKRKAYRREWMAKYRKRVPSKETLSDLEK